MGHWERLKRILDYSAPCVAILHNFKIMDNRISVVINTYNASEHLQEVLDSVKDFDEVLICDMESTDNTLEIAKANGCKVVTFPKGNHCICEPARDFAIHSATHPWVFVVDADEVVPKALKNYLYDRISQPGFSSALAVARKNRFMGLPAYGSPDYQLRFFLKDKATWPPIIHARPIIEGKIEYIPSCRKDLYLNHLDDMTVATRVDKMNRYSDYEVPKRLHKHYGAFKLLTRPFWFFIRSYIFRGGFRDGERGILKAYLDSTYQVIFLSKLYEQHINKNN